MKTPTPKKIKQARLKAGLTQTEAGALVHVALRTWQQWEHGDFKMSCGLWELFNIKLNHIDKNTTSSGMGFSMDGLRKNMSNDIGILKQLIESIALTDFGIINHSGVDCEDLKNAMNQVIQNSNILNCTFNDEIEDDWNLMLDSCVELIGDENE